MKRFAGAIVLGWMLLPLAGMGLARLAGYTLELGSIPVYVLLTAILAAAAALTPPEGRKADRLVRAILAPLSFLWAAAWMLLFGHVHFYGDECPAIVVSAFAVLVFIACCAGAFRSVRGVPRTVSLVLAGLLAVPMCVFLFVDLLFGNFGKAAVTQTVPSPDGALKAQVWDLDEGALGGDTVVEVRETRELNAGVFRLGKTPRRVYEGEWGEAFSMELQWKDDSTLIINGVPYTLDGG